MKRIVLPVLAVATALPLLALSEGCLSVAGAGDSAAITAASTRPSAGTYWVEQRNGALAYFEMPQARNAEGRWTPLVEEDGTWFSGPAFYSLTGDGVWSRAGAYDGQVLDDLLQVWDARPAAP